MIELPMIALIVYVFIGLVRMALWSRWLSPHGYAWLLGVFLFVGVLMQCLK